MHLLGFLLGCSIKKAGKKKNQLLRKLLGESVAGAEGETSNSMGKMKLNIHRKRNPREFMDLRKLNIHRKRNPGFREIEY